MSYDPKPGSTAYRVLAFLQTLPAGTEVMTSKIADALGMPPNNVSPCLEAALKAGAIYRRQRDDHVRSPFWWSLVDHSKGAPPPKRATVYVRERDFPEGQASQQVLKAEGVSPDATDREMPAKPSPVGGPMGAGQPAAAGPAGEHGFVQRESGAGKLRIALWNDGALAILRDRDGLQVLLNPDETRQLLGYLDRLRGDAA